MRPIGSIPCYMWMMHCVFLNACECVWIGLDDKSQEGYFKYASDDTSITYTDWDTAQPDNGIWFNGNLEEDCVKLWKWPYANRFKWSDGLYSVKQSFVCEHIQGK